MQAYLEQAAAVSDLSSIYRLSKAVSPLMRGLPHDAMDGSLQAVEHNDPYAMLRLFQREAPAWPATNARRRGGESTDRRPLADSGRHMGSRILHSCSRSGRT